MSPVRPATHATNPVTDKLRGGEPSVGTWLTLCSPGAAESMAHVGWDWLVVDIEHSQVGLETMTSMFRAIQLGGAVPMARVPWNDTVWIQRTLDAGALGLVVPMINSAEEAQSAVANMRYATKGQRSWGSSRVAAYVGGGEDYRAWADENIAIIVMIETIGAVERADAILGVDGVVACLVGPNDLALSMGLGMSDVGQGTPHEDAIQEVLAACRRTGKAAGKHCTDAAEVVQRIDEGFQFLPVASDSAFMDIGARAAFAAIERRDASSVDVPATAGKLY